MAARISFIIAATFVAWLGKDGAFPLTGSAVEPPHAFVIALAVGSIALALFLQEKRTHR